MIMNILTITTSFLWLMSCHGNISKPNFSVSSNDFYNTRLLNVTEKYKKIASSNPDSDNVLVGTKSTYVGDLDGNATFIEDKSCAKSIPKIKSHKKDSIHSSSPNYLQAEYGINSSIEYNQYNGNYTCIGSHACPQEIPPEAKAYWISPRKIIILIPKFYGLPARNAIIKNPNLKDKIISYTCSEKYDCVFFDGPNSVLPSISYEIYNRRPTR